MSKVKEGADTLNWMGFTALELLEHHSRDFKSFIIRNILMDANLKSGNEQNNFPPPSATIVDHRESTKLARSSKKRRKWFKYQGDWIEETRGALMVVATVITTITFQPAVSPPGGVWQTNVNDTSQGFGCNPNNTCAAGTSVLGSTSDFDMFICFNTISFTASVCIIFLLISGLPLKNKFFMGLSTFAMCTTLIFLAFAYLEAIFLVVRDYHIYPTLERVGASNGHIRPWAILTSKNVLERVMGIYVIISNTSERNKYFFSI